MSSGGHAPPWTARCPRPPCQGEGPWSLCLGLPGRGAHCLLPLSTPLFLAPPPHQAFLTPPPLPFWGPGSVTSSLPPMTLRLWSFQPHGWLWGLLLLQLQSPFAILKQGCCLLPCLSLVHISAQCCPGPSPCTLSHRAPGRHATFCWPSPLPVAQAAAGQAHGSACMK